MPTVTYPQLRKHSRPVLGSLMRMFDVARQRRHLARLDDRALADIGLNRRDVQVETSRGFWDIY
ncbi:MAG: DUF1127 domain-containing protein [Pseudomonadota bacterium]